MLWANRWFLPMTLHPGLSSCPKLPETLLEQPTLGAGVGDTTVRSAPVVECLLPGPVSTQALQVPMVPVTRVSPSTVVTVRDWPAAVVWVQVRG